MGTLYNLYIHLNYSYIKYICFFSLSDEAHCYMQTQMECYDLKTHRQWWLEQTVASIFSLLVFLEDFIASGGKADSLTGKWQMMFGLSLTCFHGDGCVQYRNDWITWALLKFYGSSRCSMVLNQVNIFWN